MPLSDSDFEAFCPPLTTLMVGRLFFARGEPESAAPGGERTRFALCVS